MYLERIALELVIIAVFVLMVYFTIRTARRVHTSRKSLPEEEKENLANFDELLREHERIKEQTHKHN